MGQTHSKISDSYNLNLSTWELLPPINDNKIWKNTTTKEQIQEYAFIVNDSKEFDRFKAAHQFRYENKFLISSRFFSTDSETEMCSTFYKGKIYLERILFTLQNLTAIPFPQVLHIYKQAFKGFGELYFQKGYFYINSNMIGFNNKFQTKVWLNSQFEKTEVNSYIFQQQADSSQKTQKQMIIRILQIVNQRTNHATCPENFYQFIAQASPYTLATAQNLLYQYASKHCIVIPQKIDILIAVDKNIIKTRKIILSDYVSSNRIFENNNSQINNNVTYDNQISTLQVVNPSSSVISNNGILSNRVQTPQLIIKQNDRKKFIKFSQPLNYRNIHLQSKPINQSVKSSSNLPIASSFNQKNNQQLIQRLPVTTTQVTNNYKKNEIKIVYGNRSAGQINLNKIQNSSISKNGYINKNIQMVNSLHNNINDGNNISAQNIMVYRTPNNLVFQNNASNQITQISQTKIPNNLKNLISQKNLNTLNLTTPLMKYNTQLSTQKQQLQKATEPQIIYNQNHSNVYDYLNTNYRTDFDKTNTYSSNFQTAGEFGYQYTTSPEILALLSKNFNFSSASPATDFIAQKAPQKIEKLDGINEMKYSIYEGTNKYIAETFSDQSIKNVESSTRIVDIQAKLNQEIYAQKEYTIALDPNLAKDLELIKQGNQKN